MITQMKPIVLAIMAGATLFLLLSCNSQNEDITNAVNKNGSVETSIQVNHLDSTHDLLITTHKVWTGNHVFKTLVYRDTLPALGLENTVAENQDGDTKNVTVKKDYEIFITVK